MPSLAHLVALAGSLALAAAQYSGEMTYYLGGTGSCGTELDTASAYFVALPTAYMGNGANPNTNALCGTQIAVTYNGVTVDASIEDTCPTCAGQYDVDASEALFEALGADLSLGRVDVTWVPI